MSRITVLIPAYNEEERIAATIRATLQRNRPKQLIVVDDGSTDTTPQVVAEFPVDLLRLPHNLGKAAAVEAGLKHANGDIIVLLDADLGRTAEYYPRLYEPLLIGEAQMTAARFTSPQGSGGLGLVRHAAAAGLWLLTRQRFPAVLSGQRAFFAKDVDNLLPLGDGYGLELALTARAIWAGLTLAAIPLPMEHAYTGRDVQGYLHRSQQFRDIWQTVWRLRGERTR